MKRPASNASFGTFLSLLDQVPPTQNASKEYGFFRRGRVRASAAGDFYDAATPDDKQSVAAGRLGIYEQAIDLARLLLDSDRGSLPVEALMRASHLPSADFLAVMTAGQEAKLFEIRNTPLAELTLTAVGRAVADH